MSGMVGRPVKPTALKLLDGEKNKDRINKQEPKPRPIIPKCPKHLTPEARRQWRMLAPMMHRIGVLTEADGAAFGDLCQAVGNWVELSTSIRDAKEPYLVAKNMVDYLGNAYVEHKPNPLYGMLDKAADRVHKLCSSFGMTPASRAKITIPGNVKGKGWEELLD